MRFAVAPDRSFDDLFTARCGRKQLPVLWPGGARAKDRFSMQAKRDPKRKAKLLSKVADYLLRTGISDLSLRPAAAALGTSARMLIYYFGSREQMLIEAMAEIRARERAQIADRIREHPFSGSVAD